MQTIDDRDHYLTPGFDYYDGDYLNSPGANVPIYDPTDVELENLSIKTYAGQEMANSPFTKAISSGVMSRRDNKKAFKAQLEWEADNMAEDLRFRRDLAAQIMLRDDDRAYNDPAAVRARKIAAGENPDLQGSSSGSGGGSSTSVPSSGSSPGTKLDPLADPLEDTLTYTGIIGNIGSAISSIVGALNGAVGFAKDVATFDNYVQDAGNSSLLLADAVESSSMAKVNQRVGLLGDIASTLTPILGEDGSAMPFTIDDVTKHLSALGIADDSGLANGVLNYTQNPALQKLYNDNILTARRSKADAVTHPFEFMREMGDYDRRLNQVTAEMDLNSAQWTLKLDELLHTDETAKSTAEVGLNTLEASKSQSKLSAEQAARSLTVFRSQIDLLGRFRQQVTSRIAKIKSNPGGVGSAYKLELSVLEPLLMRLDVIGNNQLDLIYDYARLFRAKQAATDILTIGSTNGNVQFGNKITENSLWSAYGIYMSDLYGGGSLASESSDESSKDVVSGVFDFLISLLTK